ncbi:transcriptional regulator, MerR family [Methylobacterium sp. 4-46]|uniref:MerR family transcriptional regulator n=1 Tax=unclassified Methylobacterium TaxID=2615210 RepID=UPI000152DED0|nr:MULTISPECIES: MerR family transcriptional regulator [Methylobacterium]ACA20499.1 transcriptional regulator, MerR family [Methylobacterium sp. 4-46]WFT79665.1 MerR family transcriptional regulator [Methylobacterium nodulans]
MTMLVAAGEPGGEKAPEAFRTISEVADDLDLPQHVLRFWETRFTQIRPLKRGGNRRYYRPEDIDLLRGVRQLLYGQGYTIRGVQRILRERGMRFVQAVGRGEQVAPAAYPEAEPPREAPAGPPLAPEDRAALSRLLDDLRACRERLAALRDRRAREIVSCDENLAE